METRYCKLCQCVIPPERVEAVPETTTCINCSDKVTHVPVAFMDYGHKTAPSLVLVDGNNPEALRLARRAFRRSR